MRGKDVTVSVCSWHEAGAKIRGIREQCEAFQRGDQPEKIEHLKLSEIWALFDSAAAVVKFCVASLEKRTASELQFRDYETYSYARQYGRTMAHVLRRHDALSRRRGMELEQWLKTEVGLPSIPISYVS